ncbi:hypothetical protein K439DRAFT_101447 [Ramaria rubella]|nr:hypothetical protein K439DRAFT_101447 [Ramaria rubella]
MLIYTFSIKAADDTVEQPGVDATPPTLPAPQLDLSISIDSILDAGAKYISPSDKFTRVLREHRNSAKEAEKLEKLSEENERLDEKLKVGGSWFSPMLSDPFTALRRCKTDLLLQNKSRKNWRLSDVRSWPSASPQRKEPYVYRWRDRCHLYLDNNDKILLYLCMLSRIYM